MHNKIEVNQLQTTGDYTSTIWNDSMMLTCTVYGVEHSIKILPWNEGA